MTSNPATPDDGGEKIMTLADARREIGRHRAKLVRELSDSLVCWPRSQSWENHHNAIRAIDTLVAALSPLPEPPAGLDEAVAQLRDDWFDVCRYAGVSGGAAARLLGVLSMLAPTALSRPDRDGEGVTAYDHAMALRHAFHAGTRWQSQETYFDNKRAMEAAIFYSPWPVPASPGGTDG